MAAPGSAPNAMRNLLCLRHNHRRHGDVFSIAASPPFRSRACWLALSIGITMSLGEILALFAAMVTLALVPSTSVALVVARSSSAGFSNGSAVAAGIVVGDLVFVFLAVFGMAVLAEVMGSFFLILRYLAGAYLIWFGISLMRSKA